MNGAGLPGMPSSSSTLPSSVTLRTKWPPSSVRNIVSSGAMCTPCARGYCPSPPGAQKIALAIEDHHRVLAAVECVDAIVAVDTDRGDLFERPAVGQFRPLGADPVFELAASENHRTPPCACIQPTSEHRHPVAERKHRVRWLRKLAGRCLPNMLPARSRGKSLQAEEPRCRTEETTGWR